MDAAGPWDNNALHGGAVAGLLARLVEEAQPPGQVIARFTVEILEPVPMQPLETRTHTVRSGRKVSVTDVELLADTALVARATGLSLRPGSGGGPDAVQTVEAEPPEKGQEPAERVRTSSPFFAGIDFRVVRGTIGEAGPVAVWCRVGHRWFEDEEPSALVRTAAATDTAYGYGLPVTTSEWLAVNVDLTIQLHRLPAGDWLLVDAATDLGRDGAGVGHALLADKAGNVGRAVQSVVVSPAPRTRS